MGFFDFIHKKNNKQRVEENVINNRVLKEEASFAMNNRPVKEESPYEVSYTADENGNLQIEFYNKEKGNDDYYDTTRLVASGKPLNIEGHKIHNCAVSWYENDERQIINKKTGKLDYINAQQYKGVLAEIDLDLLLVDKDYCNKVMRDLLNKKRVEKYLTDGLEEEPDIPCGKYVGGIMKTEKGYKKFFSKEVGIASHNSISMKKSREEYRMIIKKQRERDIQASKMEIKRLQDKISEMDR